MSGTAKHTPKPHLTKMICLNRIFHPEFQKYVGYRLLRMHESYEHVLIDLEVIRGSGFTRFGPPP